MMMRGKGHLGDITAIEKEIERGKGIELGELSRGNVGPGHLLSSEALITGRGSGSDMARGGIQIANVSVSVRLRETSSILSEIGQSVVL